MTTTQDNLLTQFGRLLQRRRFVGAAMRTQEPVGHGRGPIRVLRLLAQQPEWTNAEIAEALDIRPSSVSALVGRLEEKGLISRADAEDDKRKAIITLTDKGQELVSEGQARREAFRTELFAALSEDEQAQLATLLGKLADDWNQHKDEHEDGPRGGFGRGPWGHGGPNFDGMRFHHHGGRHGWGPDFVPRHRDWH